MISMKIIKKLYIVTLTFSFGLLFSQKNREVIIKNDNVADINAVSKTVFNETKEVPVSLQGAQYDINKNNLPYFLTFKTVSENNFVKTELKNIQSVALSADASKKITTFFKSQINYEFKSEIQYAQNGNENIAYLKIIPYRLNNQNIIEELISYEVEWEILPDESLNKQKKSSGVFNNNSVLASGNWYKIGIAKTGIYKLDKTFLKNIGIDVSSINPKDIRIYGNGGHMLPEANYVFRYDDLQENSIQVIGENDNVFDNTDYVLFYGVSTDEWQNDKNHSISCLNFHHQLNYYSDSSYYYITTDLGQGKRIIDQPSLNTAPTNVSSSYDYFDYHEVNTTNFIKSGRQFYGEYFDLIPSFSFSYPINNLVVGDTVKALVSVASRGATVSNYNLSYGGSTTTFSASAVNINDYLGDYVSIITNCSWALCNDPFTLNFAVTKQTASSIGWLDYIMFNCRRNLVFNNTQFCFRDFRTSGHLNIKGINNTNVDPLYTLTKFVMNTNNFSNISVWNVGDFLNVKNQLYNLSGSQLDFTASNDSLTEYLVFSGSDFLTPVFVSKVANQNLHSVTQTDFIIVSHPSFLLQAQRLAQIHQQYDSLNATVVTTEQVYNEFSSGKPDIGAIRDFARMIYSRNLNSSKPLKYLLLFGDGSFKVKDRNVVTNTSFIPVYENENSYSPTLSTVSDDFFGWLDPKEGGDWSSSLVDIGVGRFPVKSDAEAAQVVSKVEAYYKKNYAFSATDNESLCSSAINFPLGDWRTWVCFIADDEDYQTHMNDADNLAKKVKNKHPELNIDKIYADSYIQYTTPGGDRYPDANSAIDHRLEKGSLILNYTGHGGEVGLGHERYLENSQILGYKNINNMPLFITATCEFSRFDDPERTSAGELCFLNPEGGAIGLLTTVRLAFSNTNFVLNNNLYDVAFERMANGQMPALGDISKLTKQKAGLSFYYLNFHLLGDPALRLSYPQKQVFTTQINNKTVDPNTSDTLRALSKVTIKGFVGSMEGNKTKKMSDFNGILFPTVFDKEQKITCLGNDPASVTTSGPFQFLLQKNIIYKGKVQVVNGDFSFSFIVPKDIAYNYDFGKLSYYAHNGQVDAIGYNKNFYIGGSSNNITVDNVGPNIALYLNDKKFVSGGTTNQKPNLYAEVADSSGINTVGTGIGHDIDAVLDGNTNKPIILNDYYEADLNSYQKGKIKYPFDQLSEGNHRLSLKVWDVQNNSSIVYTDFVVAQSAEMALTHVLNYPNPFTTRTKFYFENNQCCTSVKVIVQIYTISGKAVKTISLNVRNEGFRSDGIDWDGKDDYGDKLAKGVYIYKLSISDSENKKAEKIEKLVILN